MLASGSNNETETFQELFADMSADARRAGNIIHGIHQFVRKAEGVRRKVNLNDSIRDVLRVLHSDLLGRATAVETELERNLPAVDADPVLVQQALLNLVMNSLEAMQSKSVGERRIAISSAREGDSFVVVSVRDRGGGLPLENPDKIFTHFYSTKPNGMGMGLTIVRSIVESHHGELGAENVEGGARFFFRLPVGDKSNPREVA
jgi:signal transduction histidine kinase